MKKALVLLCLVFSIFGLITNTAEAGTVTVSTITPSATIPVGTAVSFKVSDDALVQLTYLMSDSLPQSTISNSNINVAGNFNWTPQEQDIGVHTLTITTLSQTNVRNTFTVILTVTQASGLSISNVSPSTSIFPDNTLSFGVSAPGYSNPSFSIIDSFTGGSGVTTLNTSNIDSNGNFSWKPTNKDVGVHNLAINVRSTNGRQDTVYVSLTVNGVLLQNISSLVPEYAQANVPYVFYAKSYGLNSPTYRVDDSFRNNTIDTLTIDTGKFVWTPTPQDVGLHTLTVTGSDGTNVGTATFQLSVKAATTTVLNTPSSNISATDNSNTKKTATKTTAVKNKPIPNPSTFIFKKNLSVGSKGKDVTELQKILKDKGFYKGPENGNFGALTKAAVIKYQSAHGIAKLGSVGPATRAELNK